MPPFKEESMKKTIFIFNDGTGQSLGSENPTNVAKLFQSQPGLIEKRQFADEFKIDPATQNVSIYVRGIGTADSKYVHESEGFWKVLARKVKEFFNLGVDVVNGKTIVDRVQRSYDLFKSVYNDGDDIVLIGFSRGAASIRILASELIKRHNVKIKYMLIFDTVYSVEGSIKILDNEPIDRFTDFDISPSVLCCDHLIAGDEMRSAFSFSPVNKRDGVRQILFSGTHSDVGGGHKSTGLSDISLKFALDQLESMGYATDFDKSKLKPNPTADMTLVIIGGLGQKHYPRKLRDLDFTVHQSVFERSKAKGTTPIALAQLSTFTASSTSELVRLNEINASFDL